MSGRAARERKVTRRSAARDAQQQALACARAGTPRACILSVTDGRKSALRPSLKVPAGSRLVCSQIWGRYFPIQNTQVFFEIPVYSAIQRVSTCIMLILILSRIRLLRARRSCIRIIVIQNFYDTCALYACIQVLQKIYNTCTIHQNTRRFGGLVRLLARRRYSCVFVFPQYNLNTTLKYLKLKLSPAHRVRQRYPCVFVLL